jgi:hypothetical protein
MMLSGRNEPQLSALGAYSKWKMLLTYGCQDPRALNVWTQAIANLETWMQKQRTEPGIIRVICAKLLAWQSGSTEEISRNFTLPAVVQKQDAIGWQLSGRPALQAGEVQHRYYEFLDSRRTGLRWLTALIQKLWDVAWDMWDHRNRVLHDQEHSVARDLQIQQITDEFATGSVGLAREAKLLFSGGLHLFSNDCRPIKRHGSSEYKRHGHERATMDNVKLTNAIPLIRNVSECNGG